MIAAGRRIALVALLLGLLADVASAIDPAEIPDPALQARYIELIHEFRCMQCQNEALADSQVGLAADLRREIRELVVAGKTDDEIRDFLVARYGEFILFRPRFSARNAWLWLGPGILLVVGAVIGWRILGARRRLLDAEPGPVEDEVEDA